MTQTPPTPAGRFRGALDVLRGHAFAVPAKRAPTVVHYEGVGGAWGEPPPPTVTAEPSLYILSEAVHAAVGAFANRVASTDLLLRAETDSGELKDIRSHPALRLLENPSAFTTRYGLLWHVVADYLLAGNAYCFLAGPARGQPAEIWRMNPRQVRIVRDKRTYVRGYLYDVEGETVPLDAGEVLHFRAPNPFDDVYGLGRLAAAALAARTGRDMDEWNRTMFAHDYAVPAGIVSTEQHVGDADWQRVKDEWRTAHGSGKRRTAFVRGGAIHFEPIGLNQTDVDFLKGALWQAEKVYRVFGTYHLLPAENADDRKLNERLFLEEQAWPLMRYIAEALSDHLLTFWGPKEGAGRLVAEFADIRPRERAIDLEEQREESKGLTLNEWRARRNLAALPGGDDVLFIHVQSGEKVAFERAALPEPPPSPPPVAPAEAERESAAEQPEDAQERAEQRENAGDEIGDDIGASTDRAAWHRELARWQKYVLRRWGQDRRPFTAQTLPGLLAELVRAALAEAEDEAGVRAVFERAHEVADGKLLLDSPAQAGKASLGVPAGTVVLELGELETVIGAQQALQQDTPADAPVRWMPLQHLHITLAHAPLVDEPQFRRAFEALRGAMPVELAITAPEVGHFEPPNGPLPIILRVAPDKALTALQRAVVDAFAAEGVTLSEYSDPEAWQPHITLGYFDRADFEPDRFDRPLGAGCRAVALAFTRESFEFEHGVLARSPLNRAPALKAYLAGKAIQATRLDFEAEFEQLLAAARSGDLDRRAWSQRMRTLLRRFVVKAYRDGLHDGGVTIGETESLDDEDQANVNEHLAQQGQYVTDFGAALFRENGISDAQAEGKPVQWWSRSIMPAYEAGRFSADRSGMYEWVLGRTEEHCSSCLTANGQRHRLRDWHRAGIIPRGDLLICGAGGFCDCNLVKTTEKARGRLSAIPREESGEA